MTRYLLELIILFLGTGGVLSLLRALIRDWGMSQHNLEVVRLKQALKLIVQSPSDQSISIALDALKVE